jgi:hypothetical protein
MIKLIVEQLLTDFFAHVLFRPKGIPNLSRKTIRALFRRLIL